MPSRALTDDPTGMLSAPLLNDDIVSQILHFTEQEEAYTCMTVCRKWQDLVYGVPGHCFPDCTVISLSPGTVFRRIYAQLRCCGSHPRVLTALSLGTLSDHERTSLLRLITVNMPWFTRIYISEGPSAAYDLDEIHMAFAHPAPRLESFVFAARPITWTSPIVPQLQLDLFRQHAPRLSSLSALGITIPRGVPLSLKHITFLAISLEGQTDFPAWVFQDFPLLQNVQFRILPNLAASIPPEPSLQHIQRIHINSSMLRTLLSAWPSMSSIRRIEASEPFFFQPQECDDSYLVLPILAQHVTSSPRFQLRIGRGLNFVQVILAPEATDCSRSVWLRPYDLSGPDYWDRIFLNRATASHLSSVILNAGIFPIVWSLLPITPALTSIGITFTSPTDLYTARPPSPRHVPSLQFVDLISHPIRDRNIMIAVALAAVHRFLNTILDATPEQLTLRTYDVCVIGTAGFLNILVGTEDPRHPDLMLSDTAAAAEDEVNARAAGTL